MSNAILFNCHLRLPPTNNHWEMKCSIHKVRKVILIRIPISLYKKLDRETFVNSFYIQILVRESFFNIEFSGHLTI